MYAILLWISIRLIAIFSSLTKTESISCDLRLKVSLSFYVDLNWQTHSFYKAWFNAIFSDSFVASY